MAKPLFEELVKLMNMQQRTPKFENTRLGQHVATDFPTVLIAVAVVWACGQTVEE